MLTTKHLPLSRKKGLGMGAPLVALIVIAAVVLLLAMWGIGGYNNLVTQDTQVSLRASNIESQLKRRADLVPNLVATVKGYASHEKEIYSNIAQARSQLLSANVKTNPKAAAEASANFKDSLGRLLAVAENYPQLKADQNFIRLQDELTGTENRMNFARVEYNEAIASYNLTVRQFPVSLIAGVTGFQLKQPFEADKADKVLPKVQF
jgi:LemA protein